MIEIGGAPLDIATLIEVARAPVGGSPKVTLSSSARARIAASRAVVERAVSEGRTVYGVSTGFGRLKDRRIDPARLGELQLNLVRSHAAGVGPAAPREVVRAMLMLRAVSLATGHSGVRLELVESLLALLESDITPVVPLQGSVGASRTWRSCSSARARPGCATSACRLPWRSAAPAWCRSRSGRRKGSP